MIKKKSLGFKLLSITFMALVLGGIVYFIFNLQPSISQVGKGRHSGRSDSVSVAVAAAEKNDIALTKQGLGTVTPLVNVTVRTQISGHLTEVAFQEGQMVQKNDFIAQIDQRPYQLALEQAQGTLTRDQALLKEAQIDLDRYKKLVALDSIARQQLDTQTSLVAQYEGNVVADQAQIDQAKLNIEYCHITSPVTGRIGLRQVDPGNYVQPSDTNGLVVVTQLQPISVLFNLPEDDVPLLMKHVGAELPVTAYDRTHTTKLSDGKLVSIDNQIDTTTGTLKLRAQFENTDNMLFPNQFVNVELLVDTLHDAITVPTAAVQRGAPGTYVYILNEDQTVSVRPVKIGPSAATITSITDGLALGEKVVVDGLDKLRDGAKVMVAGSDHTNTPSSKDAPDNNKANSDTNSNKKPTDGEHHHRNAP